VFVPIEILSSLRVGSNRTTTTVAPTPAHFHSPHFFVPTPIPTPTQSFLGTPALEIDPPVPPAAAPEQPASEDPDAPAAGSAAIAIPLSAPSLLTGPPPPTWAESVSPETPGGWLSMPPSYFASALVRVEEEVGSPAEEMGWVERERERRPSLVGAVRSLQVE